MPPLLSLPVIIPLPSPPSSFGLDLALRLTCLLLLPRVSSMSKRRAQDHDSSSDSASSYLTQVNDSDDPKAASAGAQIKRPRATGGGERKHPRRGGEETEEVEVNISKSGTTSTSRASAGLNKAQRFQPPTGSRGSRVPRTIVVTEKLLHFLKQGPDRGACQALCSRGSRVP